MPERGWAEAIDLPAGDAAAFETIAEGLGVPPEALVRRLVARVVEADATARRYGLGRLAHWVEGGDAVRVTGGDALDALPLSIRETEFMWPSDTPFPWTAEQCRAAVLGYQVRWGGDLDDFLQKLRGRWEMIDGYVVLHQS